MRGDSLTVCIDPAVAAGAGAFEVAAGLLHSAVTVRLTLMSAARQWTALHHGHQYMVSGIIQLLETLRSWRTPLLGEYCP